MDIKALDVNRMLAAVFQWQPSGSERLTNKRPETFCFKQPDTFPEGLLGVEDEHSVVLPTPSPPQPVDSQSDGQAGEHGG